MPQYRVTNFGRPRPFPTYLGPYFIGRFSPIYTDDKRIVKELKNMSKRSDIQLKIEKVDGGLEVDYSKHTIQELRKVATQVGIKGAFFMKKVDLIKSLEEKDES